MKNTNGQFDTDNFHTAEPVIVSSGCTHWIKPCADNEHRWMVSAIRIADQHDGKLNITIDQTCIRCLQWKRIDHAGHRNTQIDVILHYK